MASRLVLHTFDNNIYFNNSRRSSTHSGKGWSNWPPHMPCISLLELHQHLLQKHNRHHQPKSRIIIEQPETTIASTSGTTIKSSNSICHHHHRSSERSTPQHWIHNLALQHQHCVHILEVQHQDWVHNLEQHPQQHHPTPLGHRQNIDPQQEDHNIFMMEAVGEEQLDIT